METAVNIYGPDVYPRKGADATTHSKLRFCAITRKV